MSCRLQIYPSGDANKLGRIQKHFTWTIIKVERAWTILSRKRTMIYGHSCKAIDRRPQKIHIKTKSLKHWKKKTKQSASIHENIKKKEPNKNIWEPGKKILMFCPTRLEVYVECALKNSKDNLICSYRKCWIHPGLTTESVWLQKTSFVNQTRYVVSTMCYSCFKQNFIVGTLSLSYNTWIRISTPMKANMDLYQANGHNSAISSIQKPYMQH